MARQTNQQPIQQFIHCSRIHYSYDERFGKPNAPLYCHALLAQRREGSYAHYFMLSRMAEPW